MNQLIHTAHHVDDLEASLKFYEAMGFEELARYQFEESIYSFLGLPGDAVGADPDDPTHGARLELIFRPPWRHGQGGPGFDHIGVAVDDLDETLAGLDGWELQLDRPKHVPDDARVCFVTDPAGRVVELIER